MEIQVLQDLLLWSLIINIVIILAWVGMVKWLGDFTYRVHSYFFPVSRDAFTRTHFIGVMVYEALVIVFNFTPLIALYIIY